MATNETINQGLSQVKKRSFLEELLAGSPKECFKVTEEDRGWIDSKPRVKCRKSTLKYNLPTDSRGWVG